MIVSLSPGGQTMTGTGSPSDLLFVGTIDGIFSFARQNGSWASQKRFLPGDHWKKITVGLPPISKVGHFRSLGATSTKRGDSDALP
jgi:hypothetical protein